MESTNQRGGTRPGAGRPRKEPTTILTFRVRSEWAAEIKQTVKKWIKDLESRE